MEMTNKERAEATYLALQKRKKAKAKLAKEKEREALTMQIESIERHRGRKDLKYFY